MINWNNVKLPKGVTQEEFLEDIYEICHIKAYQHSTKTKAKFLSFDDLKQEFIMKCFRSLPTFDPAKAYDAEKGKWKLYFYRACDSVSRDIDKKYTFDRSVPCKTCPLFDKKTKTCTKFEVQQECEDWAAWSERSKRKFMLGSMFGTLDMESKGDPRAGGADHTSMLSNLDTAYVHKSNDPQQDLYSRDREGFDYSSNTVDLFDYVETKCTPEIQAIFKDLCESNYDPKQVGAHKMKKLRSALKGKFDWS